MCTYEREKLVRAAWMARYVWGKDLRGWRNDAVQLIKLIEAHDESTNAIQPPNYEKKNLQ